MEAISLILRKYGGKLIHTKHGIQVTFETVCRARLARNELYSKHSGSNIRVLFLIKQEGNSLILSNN